MNRGGARGRSRPGANRGANARVMIGNLKSSLHGHRNKLSGTNPPPVNLIPYNTITLTLDEGGQADTLKVLTVYSIREALLKQLNLEGKKVRFKIQRIDVWSLANEVTGAASGVFAVNPTVFARFFSLVQSVGNTSTGAVAFPVVMKEMTDTGLSGQSAAVVSYSYPRDQADLALKPAPPGEGVGPTDEPKVVEIRAPVTCTMTIRLHLHWSPIELEEEVNREYI